jgi:transcriptional regulator with XRE-family HTH domain
MINQEKLMENKSITKDRETRKKRLRNKPYRDAHVASQINIAIPLQVRALREQCEFDQKTLANKAGMKQPRISAIENGSGKGLNLNTLLRLASAFDVALIVRFAPFSELNAWVEGLPYRVDGFSPNDFHVTTFEKDPGMKSQSILENATMSALPTPYKAKTQPQLPQREVNEIEPHSEISIGSNAQSNLPV